MNDNKDFNTAYRIVKIQTIQFSFEELTEEAIKNLFSISNQAEFTARLTLDIDSNESLVHIAVNTQLKRKKDNLIIVNHTGKTSFKIEGLDKLFDKKSNTYQFPNEILIQLHSISYTHSRALLATELNSTTYNDKYFLPIIDPTKLMPENQHTIE